MPRISASTVADHVAQQEAAVFQAAVDLFCRRGYRNVSLGDIAAEVGLARNSLYRYFPDKAHILLRWYRAELPVQAERAARVLTADRPPIERLAAWIDDQLDYAARPEHALVASLAEVLPELDDTTRAELADSHRLLLAPLDTALRDAGLKRADDRAAVMDLIGGLVMAAAQHEQRLGSPSRRVRRQALAAVAGMLSPAPTGRRSPGGGG